VSELGRAHRREVLRMRKQDRPGIADPVVEPDRTLGRLRLEVGRGVAELYCHRSPPRAGGSAQHYASREGSRRVQPVTDELGRLGANAAPLPSPPDALHAYLDKVAVCAYTITDADIDGLKAAGIDEDVIFEQTVGVAIREGLRRFEAAERV